MKRKTGEGSAWITGLLVLAAIALALWPAQGRAACTTSAAALCASLTQDDGRDSDEDGFSDYLECTGFSTGGNTPITGFINGAGSRNAYLDPCGKDLFVAVATSTRITEADLQYVVDTLLSKLGIAVHRISSTDYVQGGPVRQVTTLSTQKGVTIAENTTTTTGSERTTLGYTYPLAQTPDNNSLTVTVYTGRLEAYVAETVCPVATYPKCVDSNGVGRQNNAGTLDPLYRVYHQQNLIHELSHSISLAPVTGSHHGVNTTSPFNNSIMSQYVFTKAYKANNKTGEPAKQVFYIPFTYDLPGDTAFRLRY